MPTIDPKTIPQVALSFMNDDHEEAIALVNQLLKAISLQDHVKTTTLLADFYRHNQEHFAREENEMRRVGFPPYECHKSEHERVLAELQLALSTWEQDKNFEKLSDYLTHTVAPWFFNHVSTMDTVTAMFVRQFDTA